MKENKKILDNNNINYAKNYQKQKKKMREK